MDKELEENKHQIYQPLVIHEREISSLDLISLFYRRKKIILIAFVITVSVALTYALFAKRIYEVEAIVLPPSVENITPLNILSAVDIGEDAKKYVLSIKDVFITVSRNIDSRTFRKKFFEKYNLLEMLTDEDVSKLSEVDKNKIFEGFSKQIKTYKQFKNNQVIRITLEGFNKDKLGYWLDRYIILINDLTINQLRNNLLAEINSRVQNLKAKIEGKKLIFAQRRADKLTRLEKDYNVAKKLGIIKHVLLTKSESTTSRSDAKSSNDIKLFQIDRENFPGYMKGTKVLRVEIDSLKQEKSTDYNIPGLRDLQEQLKKYEAIKIDINTLQALTVDKHAVSNIKPIKPQRRLIVLASCVLGLLLGISIVLFLEFLKKVREHNAKLGLT